MVFAPLAPQLLTEHQVGLKPQRRFLARAYTQMGTRTSSLQWSSNYSMQRNSGARRGLLKQMAERCVHSS